MLGANNKEQLLAQRRDCETRIARDTFLLREDRDKEIEGVRKEQENTLRSFNAFLLPLWEKHEGKFKSIDDFKQALLTQDKKISLSLLEKKELRKYVMKLEEINSKLQAIADEYEEKIEKKIQADHKLRITLNEQLEPLLLRDHPARLIGLIKQLATALPFLDKRYQECQSQWRLFANVVASLEALDSEVKADLQKVTQETFNTCNNIIKGKEFPLLMLQEDIKDLKEKIVMEKIANSKKILLQQLTEKEKELQGLSISVAKQNASFMELNAVLAAAQIKISTLPERKKEITLPAPELSSSSHSEKDAKKPKLIREDAKLDLLTPTQFESQRALGIKKTTAVKSGLDVIAKAALEEKENKEKKKDKGPK